VWQTVPEAATGDWKNSVADSYESAMMMMNEVVDGWKRQHVGRNQIGLRSETV